ncbi:MAG: anti-sigma factor [Planctomycetaceae bacterium]|nr:anti-sigma factor [Planctomycetaceae bacterium]
MNTPLDNSHSDHPDEQTDALLGEWIRESGDTLMTPRTEHVVQLKDRLLEMSSQRATSSPETISPPLQRPTRRGWMWATLAGAAAVIAVSLLPSGTHESAAWAQVREAVSVKPWMHTQTTYKNGMMIESWFSPKKLVAASKSVPPSESDLKDMPPMAMFVDIRQRARFEYQSQSNEIVTYPMLDSDETTMKMVVGFVSAFADGKDFPEIAEEIPEFTISERRDVEVEGQRLHEFDANVVFHGQKSTCMYRVDPVTNLPVSSTIEVQGETLETSIDFPDFGPESIYDLGVNKGVSVRNLMPVPELSRLLEQRQLVRMNFDGYFGFVVQVPPKREWWNSVSVRRIWRDGTKWRTEYMNCDYADSKRIHGREAPPEGTDPLEWLSAQAEHERFRLTNVSDGTNTWRGEYEVKKSETNPEHWEYIAKPAIQNPYPINPKDPLPTSINYPEFMVYGPTGLPGSRRTGKLILKPNDGPEGTVKIESRITGDSRPHGNDLSYYWVDPLENGMMRKTQMFSLAGGEPNLLADQLVLETARSPNGYLYPTRLQHDDGSVTHFYLDFDADFDDSVFDPSANPTVPSSE